MVAAVDLLRSGYSGTRMKTSWVHLASLLGVLMIPWSIHAEEMDCDRLLPGGVFLSPGQRDPIFNNPVPFSAIRGIPSGRLTKGSHWKGEAAHPVLNFKGVDIPLRVYDDRPGFLRIVDRDGKLWVAKKEELDQVLGALLPRELEDLISRGDQFFDRYQFRCALREYEKVVDLMPSNPYLLLRIGQSYSFLDDLSGASEHLQEARRLDPRNPMVLNELALLSIAAGDLSAAYRLFREAYQLDPKQSVLSENLISSALLMSEAEFGKGNDTTALGYLEQAMAELPDDSGMMKIYLEMKRVMELEKTIRTDSPEDNAWLAAGDRLLSRAKSLNAALKKLEEKWNKGLVDQDDEEKFWEQIKQTLYYPALEAWEAATTYFARLWDAAPCADPTRCDGFGVILANHPQVKQRIQSAYLGFGQLLYEGNFLDEAVLALKQAAQFTPSQTVIGQPWVRAEIMRMAARVDQGEIDEPLRVLGLIWDGLWEVTKGGKVTPEFERLREAYPKVLLAKADENLQSYELEFALALTRKALMVDPTLRETRRRHVAVLVELSRDGMRYQLWDRAIQLLDEAIAVDPFGMTARNLRTHARVRRYLEFYPPRWIAFGSGLTLVLLAFTGTSLHRARRARFRASVVRRATKLFQQQQWAEALDQYRLFKQLRGNRIDAEIYGRLAECAENLGNLEGALYYYEKAGPLFWKERCRIYLRRTNVTRVVSLLKAHAENAEQLKQHAQEMLVYLQQKLLPEVQSDAVIMGRDIQAAYECKARLLLLTGEVRRADQLFTALISRAPEVTRAVLPTMIDIVRELGDRERLKKLLIRSIRLDAKTADAASSLSELYAEDGALVLAAKAALLAASRSTGERLRDVALQRSQAALELLDRVAVSRQLAKALRPYFVLGRRVARRRMFDIATTIFTKLCQHTEFDLIARVMLADCQVAKGDYDQAVVNAKWALGEFRGSTDFWAKHARYCLGRAYQCKGQDRLAHEQFELIKQQDPYFQHVQKFSQQVSPGASPIAAAVSQPGTAVDVGTKEVAAASIAAPRPQTESVIDMRTGETTGSDPYRSETELTTAETQDDDPDRVETQYGMILCPSCQSFVVPLKDICPVCNDRLLAAE